MILVDANLLVYARVSELPQHGQARDWLDEQLNGIALVGLPWPSLLAFLRIVTNPRLFERCEAMTAAWEQIESWLACSCVWIPQPSEKHQTVLGPLLSHIGGGSNLVPDAHLAALAVEHGLTLYSADGDFARFPGLKWMNPLANVQP